MEKERGKRFRKGWLWMAGTWPYFSIRHTSSNAWQGSITIFARKYSTFERMVVFSIVTFVFLGGVFSKQLKGVYPDPASHTAAEVMQQMCSGSFRVKQASKVEGSSGSGPSSPQSFTEGVGQPGTSWIPIFNLFLMDGNGEFQPHFPNKGLVHHPTETSILKWMFRVPS